MLVDGGWSSWSLWSRCDRVCGGGKRQRLRSCTNPPPSSGGKGCGSHYYESKECAVNKCPALSAFAFRPFAVSPWSSVCLSLSPSFFLFVCLPIYLSFWLFVGQTDRLSVHYRSFWLSVCLLYSSGGLFFWLCFCLSVCLLVCLSISLSVCPPARLSVCASGFQFIWRSVWLCVCLSGYLFFSVCSNICFLLFVRLFDCLALCQCFCFVSVCHSSFIGFVCPFYVLWSDVLSICLSVMSISFLFACCLSEGCYSLFADTFLFFPFISVTYLSTPHHASYFYEVTDEAWQCNKACNG